MALLGRSATRPVGRSTTYMGQVMLDRDRLVDTLPDIRLLISD